VISNELEQHPYEWRAMQEKVTLALVVAAGSGIAIGVQATLNNWAGRLVGPTGTALLVNFIGGCSTFPLGGQTGRAGVWRTRYCDHHRNCIFLATSRNSGWSVSDHLGTNAGCCCGRYSGLGRCRADTTESSPDCWSGVSALRHLVVAAA